MLTPILGKTGHTISKSLVFTQRPCLTDEEILAKRSKKQKSNGPDEDNKKSSPCEAASEKRGRGRPPGSKNKKTLEREAAQASNAETASEKESKKRGRGRPPGSKNKKTLEREAARVSNAETASEKES